MKAYLLSVAAISILNSLVLSLLPKGAVRRVAGFAGGLLMIVTVLSPIVRLDYDNFARMITQLQIETENLETGVQAGNQKLLADIIKERCETYILDKAEDLGMLIQVDVELEEDAEYPYPIKAVISGSFAQWQRDRLSDDISENLGIPAKRQEWISM